MNKAISVVAVAVLALGGCFTPIAPVSFEERGLGALSKTGCSNLEGHYINLVSNKEGRSHEYFYHLGGLTDREYLVSTGNANRDPAAKGKRVKGWELQTGKTIESFTMLDPTTSTVRVEQGRGIVTLILFDGDGYEWSRKQIGLGGSPDVGCRDGALVLRWRKLGGGADSTPISQTYGEVILRKEPDGSILMSTWMRSTQYSPLLHAPSPGMSGGSFTQTWRVKPVGAK
jgi:hypothetical protein